MPPRERPPGVDHPLGVPNRRQIAPECGGLMQVAERGEEFQFSGVEGVFQVAQEQTPEHSRQYPDRKEELRPTGDPASAIGRDTTAGNEKMNMRVV